MAEETPRRTYDRWFENSLLTGFFLSMVCFFATIMLWPTRDLNTFWPALTISLMVTATLPIAANLLAKQPKTRLVKCLLTSLMFSLMVAGMFGSIIAMSLVDDYAAAPVLSRFAAEDFDSLADGNTVSLAKVKATVEEQRAVAAALVDLDKMDKTIDALPVSGASQFIAHGGFAPAHAELKLKELPADQVDRLKTVERYLPQAGHPAGQSAGHYEADRAELNSFNARLHSKYALWSWVLERFGLI